ncbi:DgyrCDS8086 [Dimorphilus gyrociliatus]|uniref:DgyrCDS8086 n=1 Tax=Dimorphilus gyrociliatus TaxID=2664684 RepID=A0A7I8VVE6_9ANNE|nr:DgyrCDS8086 [Dimorphilus gyrociliatus]
MVGSVYLKNDSKSVESEFSETSTMTEATEAITSSFYSMNRGNLLYNKLAEDFSIQPWNWPDSASDHLGSILRIVLASAACVVCVLILVAVNGSKKHRCTSLGVIVSSMCVSIIARGSILEFINTFKGFRSCDDFDREQCPQRSNIINLILTLQGAPKQKCSFGHFCYKFEYKVECPLWIAISEAVDMTLPFALLAASFERLRVGCGGRTGYCASICFVLFCWLWPFLSAAGIFYLPEVVNVLPKLVESTWRKSGFTDCRVVYSWIYWIITGGIRLLPPLICFLAGSIVLCTKRAKLKCTLLVTALLNLFYIIFIAPHYVVTLIFHKETVLVAAVLTRVFNLLAPLMFFLYDDVREATRLTLCGASDIEDGSEEDRTPMKQDMDEMEIPVPTAPKYDENVPLKASPDDYSI